MCNFSVHFDGTKDDLITKIMAEVAGHGTVDTGTGEFNINIPLGHVSGSFTIVEQQLNVTIDHKPLLIGCGSIQTQVESFLN